MAYSWSLTYFFIQQSQQLFIDIKIVRKACKGNNKRMKKQKEFNFKNLKILRRQNGCGHFQTK